MGRGDCITSHANAVGKFILCACVLQYSCLILYISATFCVRTVLLQKLIHFIAQKHLQHSVSLYLSINDDDNDRIFTAKILAR